METRHTIDRLDHVTEFVEDVGRRLTRLGVEGAVALALPFPLLAALAAATAPDSGASYTPWNYWCALMMPVMLSLASATVANADARMGNRPLLSIGTPLSCAWVAKTAWCLVISLLSILLVFAVYATLSVAVPEGAASIPAMLSAALSLVIANSWMIPATLFLTMRAGMLAGAFVPLAAQLGLSFGWSAVPFWPACPPTATIVFPTAFLPVLPSGELELSNRTDDEGNAIGACAVVRIPFSTSQPAP